MKTKYYAQGFTLIELAMVLFILGLLLSSFLAPLAARVEQRERNETEIQLEEIKDVLFGYVIRQGQFPCPDCRLAGEGTCIAADVDDGFEDRNLGECKSEVGNLPWADLGVGPTFIPSVIARAIWHSSSFPSRSALPACANRS